MKAIEKIAPIKKNQEYYAHLRGYGVSIIFLALATIAVSFGSQITPAKSIVGGVGIEDEASALTPAITKSLTHAENTWAQGHSEGNPSLIAPILSHDFVSTDAAGSVRNSRNYLKALTAPAPLGKTVVPPVALDIRVYGTTAVVIGQTRAAGRTERFTHIYHNSGRAWQMVASQATRLKG